MRIMVNAEALAPVGGVELSSLQVGRELARRGEEFDLLYRFGGELEQQWRDFADTVQPVPNFLVRARSPVRDVWTMWPAVKAAGRLHPDVLWLNRAEHLIWGLAAARAARTPLVCHLRTHPHIPMVRRLARGVSRFIAVSSYIKELWVQAGIDPNQIDVVLNGVDSGDYPVGGRAELAEARQRLGMEEQYVVLYYGRLHPEKGLDVLLEAWQKLNLEDAVLLLAGDPYPGTEGTKYAERLRATAPPGVRLIGMQRDVVSMLHAADTVVLPAQWQEPFGRVVAEGLASGRPVVASRVGGIPEQLTGELAQMLFDPQDVDGLAERLAGLRHWRREDPGLGARCAAHAQSQLSLSSTADGVQRVLASAAGRSAVPVRRP
jgi:glycosyltransferase involved in cell wall biosynthesis